MRVRRQTCRLDLTQPRTISRDRYRPLTAQYATPLLCRRPATPTVPPYLRLTTALARARRSAVTAELRIRTAFCVRRLRLQSRRLRVAVCHVRAALQPPSLASTDIATRRLLRGLPLWSLPVADHSLATQGAHDFSVRYAPVGMYVCVSFIVTRWLHTLSRWLGVVQGSLRSYSSFLYALRR
jgi:hypothetical protein